jgi:hypothetical protein
MKRTSKRDSVGRHNQPLCQKPLFLQPERRMMHELNIEMQEQFR